MGDRVRTLTVWYFNNTHPVGDTLFSWGTLGESHVLPPICNVSGEDGEAVFQLFLSPPPQQLNSSTYSSD